MRDNMQQLTPEDRRAASDSAAYSDRFQFLFDCSPQPMWLCDRSTLKFLEVNQAAVEMYGYSKAEFLGKTLADIRPAEDAEDLWRELQGYSDEYRKRSGRRHRHKDGSILWVDVNSRLLEYQGRPVIISVITSATARKRIKESLLLQNAYFKQLYANSIDAIAIIDNQGAICDVNPAFERMFQYAQDELAGKYIRDSIVPESHRHEILGQFKRLRREGSVKYEAVRQRKDGNLLIVSVAGHVIQTDDQDLGHCIIYRDITQLRRVVYEMERQAIHDVLTDVLTRREFERKLEQHLQSGDDARLRGMLLFVDIDQFQAVNDANGYVIGDSVLQSVASIIKMTVRDNDLVARLVGDEFAVLMTDCSIELAQATAARILAAIRSHVFIFGQSRFTVTAGIGLARLGEATRSRDVLATADSACRAAKDKGGDQSLEYEASDQDVSRHRHDSNWLIHLRDALDRNRFVLYRQSIRHIDGGESPRHSEILLRIRRDDGSIALPELFIPTAERYRLMPRLDRHVVEKVFARIVETRGTEPPGIVAINISGETIGNRQFVDHVKDLFKSTGVPPANICFELTETSAIGSMENAAMFIKDMRQLGCAVALDDFGSGMATFEYLKKLQIDYLKIDKIFITDLVGNPVGHEMVRAITSMAKATGVKTIAEHVQTQRILDDLRTLGVDYVQGYAIHTPEPW